MRGKVSPAVSFTRTVSLPSDLNKLFGLLERGSAVRKPRGQFDQFAILQRIKRREADNPFRFFEPRSHLRRRESQAGSHDHRGRRQRRVEPLQQRALFVFGAGFAIDHEVRRRPNRGGVAERRRLKTLFLANASKSSASRLLPMIATLLFVIAVKTPAGFAAEIAAQSPCAVESGSGESADLRKTSGRAIRWRRN